MPITYNELRWLRAVNGLPVEDLRYPAVALQCDLSVEELPEVEEKLKEHYHIDEDKVVQVNLTAETMEQVIEMLLWQIYKVEQERTKPPVIDFADHVEKHLDEIFGG